MQTNKTHINCITLCTLYVVIIIIAGVKIQLIIFIKSSFQIKQTIGVFNKQFKHYIIIGCITTATASATTL